MGKTLNNKGKDKKNVNKYSRSYKKLYIRILIQLLITDVYFFNKMK